MPQKINYVIQLLALLGLAAALLFRARPEKRQTLRHARKVGCLSGGCLLPALLFGVVMAVAKSAADLGGPLFWPLLAALGATLGFVTGTLFFILFQRNK